ncbi:MAG: N-acetylmuramoyl-L-alanine amidase [Saprospiraceae bacterium]|nr:N-acetylmuramoyl-L-alanine amidase [Saprospiraceae bacterium]
MRLLFFLLIFSLAGSLAGQSTYVVRDAPMLDMHLGNRGQISYSGTVLDLPFHADPFIAMNIEWRSTTPIPPASVRMQYQKNDSSSPWLSLSQDEHVGNGATRFFTNMVFLEPDTRALFLRVDVDAPWDQQLIDTLIVHLFDPGPTTDVDHTPQVPSLRNDECTCPPPTLVDRSQWCPDGTCFPHPSPEPVFPTHLIIHHSAGSNNSSDWAAVVRSIWNFHVNGNGWSDIGYNWLVDPNGQVYIGRGDDILGAHFCGKNSNTLGTCVMGDFTAVQPTPTALTALSDLYAWKACVENIDPLGSAWHPASGAVIPNVSGHRQSCNTSCPGDAFFPMLPQVREQIAGVIHMCNCDLSAPEGLKVESLADRVHLTWEPVGGASSYLLERKGPNDADFTLLAKVGNTIYQDLTVQAGLTYAYRVRADDGNCSSDPSDQIAIDVADEWFFIQPTLVTNHVEVHIRNGTAEPVQMTMTGMDGRQVWAGEFGKSTVEFVQSVQMASFPAGVYILQVKQGAVKKTVRLTKM